MMIKKIQKERIQAMKDKDVLKKNILSLVVSNAQMAAKINGDETPSNNQVISVIKKLRKNNQDLLDQAPNNSDAKIEIEILESYLPAQMSDEALKNIISEFVATLEEEGGKAIGIVMKHLNQNYSGLFDNKKASEIIKKILT